jgi:predicted CoA-binding protein
MAGETAVSSIDDILRDSRTIAVVGASSNPKRDSNRIFKYLLDAGYTVLPVNPGETEVLGQKAYPDLRSLPVKVDVVDIFRRPEAVPGIVEDAIAIGAKAVWMQLGIRHAAAARKAREAGLRVVQDRCIYVEHFKRYGDKG